jgi:branched-chain amino acid transport system permease protein
MPWLNAVVQGVLLGGLYALLAAGLSLMFGVMRIVNLAHGVLAVVASYAGLALVEKTGMSPFLSILLVVPAMAAVGYGIQRGLLNRALSKGGLSPLLVTFGLAVVVTQLLQQFFSADTRSIDIGQLGVSSLKLGSGLFIGWFPLIVFVIGVCLIAGLQLFLSRTPLGRAMRACSDDVETVNLMGIDNRQVYALSTALALGALALAGVFMGMRTQFSPGTGDVMLIVAFEAVIIGGLGSLWGTLAGSVILGIAQTVGAQFNPAYGVLIGHLVFLLVLAFRPTGLLPKVVNA